MGLLCLCWWHAESHSNLRGLVVATYEERDETFRCSDYPDEFSRGSFLDNSSGFSRTMRRTRASVQS
ncbi:hypothetical protein ALP24_200007 [Pseudomonas syringae pv. aptata]|uniref:Uncharacterized protein n=1 Tax=Pseudomonas syringae pv. aptata TaxID=83167 RepID=A0A3M5X228_PSEAP|nr:hypothetical protein ALP24_200007 [Pseudomonas syringae pv. aptata]